MITLLAVQEPRNFMGCAVVVIVVKALYGNLFSPVKETESINIGIC